MDATGAKITFETVAREAAAERNRQLQAENREEAGCVLATSGTSISEVAARWHFADSGHFSRTFKKQHSLTPTAYAASARGRREKA